MCYSAAEDKGSTGNAHLACWLPACAKWEVAQFVLEPKCTEMPAGARFLLRMRV